MAHELASHPEVLAEALQTVLRAQGHPAPYEALKETTRGEAVTMAVLHELLDRLEMDEATRTRLKAMTPEGYTGYAERLADMGIAASEKLLAELRG
ncbi:Adenylosuccinate lyase [compost metagenome]